MNGPIYIKSSERIEFEPECVNCGRSTRRTFSIDTATPAAVGWISLLIPYSMIFNYLVFMRKGLVRIPFCFRCHQEYFLPDKSTIAGVIIAVVLLVLFIYLMMLEYFIAASASVVVAFISTFSMLREDRSRSSVTMPFRAWKDSGEFYYQFHSGHYYDLLKSTLEKEG